MMQYLVEFWTHSQEWHMDLKVLVSGWGSVQLVAEARKFFKKSFSQFKKKGVIHFYEGLPPERRGEYCQKILQMVWDIVKAENANPPNMCPQHGQKNFRNLCWFDATVFATLIDPSKYAANVLNMILEEHPLPAYLRKMRDFIYGKGNAPTRTETVDLLGPLDMNDGRQHYVDDALHILHYIVKGHVMLDNPENQAEIMAAEKNLILRLENLHSATWAVFLDQPDNMRGNEGLPRRKPLDQTQAELLEKHLQPYAYVLPTSKKGSHWFCIYACEDKYYKYDGYGNIRESSEQKLNDARNNRPCYIFCHSTQSNGQNDPDSDEDRGETKQRGVETTQKATPRRRRRREPLPRSFAESNPNQMPTLGKRPLLNLDEVDAEFKSQIETYQRGRLGVKYSLRYGDLPHRQAIETEFEDTDEESEDTIYVQTWVLIPAYDIKTKIRLWFLVNDRKDVYKDESYIKPARYNGLTDQEWFKCCDMGITRAYMPVIETLEFCGKHNMERPHVERNGARVKLEIEKIAVDALERKQYVKVWATSWSEGKVWAPNEGENQLWGVVEDVTDLFVFDIFLERVDEIETGITCAAFKYMANGCLNFFFKKRVFPRLQTSEEREDVNLLVSKMIKPMYGLHKDILKEPDVAGMYELLHSFNPVLAFYVCSAWYIEDFKRERRGPALKIQALVRGYIARKKLLQMRHKKKEAEKTPG